MDESLKAMDMVMQIIFNITGKAIAETIPLLGKFAEKVEGIAVESMVQRIRQVRDDSAKSSPERSSPF